MSDLNNSESLLKNLVKIGISRREFIQRSMAAGMTVAAAETLFMNTAASYDPALYGLGGEQSFGLYGATFNNMIEVGPDRKLQGEIAESWEPSPDAKTWTFKIRKDIEFHNGKTVTSADVVASINHHRGEDSKSGGKSIVESIVDIRADGPDYVVMDLQEGNADMPYLLTDYHLVICPAVGDKIDWESVIGTGAYIMSRHIPGVSMDLTRNPNYFKPDRGWFDTAQCLHIADTVAKNTALVTGSIHIIDKGAARTLRMLEQAGGIEIDVITGTQHYTIPMHTNKAPFDNNDVRLALKHAIDREALLKTILNGHGEVGNDSPITSGNRYFNTEMPQRRYDIDKAKFHLKKAGLSTLNVDLSTSETAFPGGSTPRFCTRSTRPRPASTSTWYASRRTATGPMSGRSSRSPCATGAGVPLRTGCSRWSTRPVRAGVTRSGRASALTAYCCKRARS